MIKKLLFCKDSQMYFQFEAIINKIMGIICKYLIINNLVLFVPVFMLFKINFFKIPLM